MIETERLTLSAWTEAERGPLPDVARDFHDETGRPAVVYVAAREAWAQGY